MAAESEDDASVRLGVGAPRKKDAELERRQASQVLAVQALP